MTRTIFTLIINRIKKGNCETLISALTYYTFLSFFPTLFLVIKIIEFINIDIDLIKFRTLDLIFENTPMNILFIIIIFSLILRVFLLLSKQKFSKAKSFVFSFVASIIYILFLITFILSYIGIKDYLFSFITKALILSVFLFLIFLFLSNSNLKYSLIFSLVFSIILTIFLDFLYLVTTYFLNYQDIYGLLAPIFTFILIIQLTISAIYLALIMAEEFTKISRVKFVKR